MITHEQRMKLMRDHDVQGAAKSAGVMKCAAGLAILTLIATIGVQSRESPDTEASRAVARERLASLARVSPSITAAQKTFDERRRRTRSASTTAGAALVSAASASIEVHNKPSADVEIVMLRRASD